MVDVALPRRNDGEPDTDDVTTDTKTRRDRRSSRPQKATEAAGQVVGASPPTAQAQAPEAVVDVDAQHIADEVLAREPVAEGEFPEPVTATPAAAKQQRVREPGESLIQVSLGEPEEAVASPATASPDADSDGIDRAALRERSPDIDLGERRRRPRPGREQAFVAPPSEPFADDAVPTPGVEADELAIDEADEKAIQEQSLAFERTESDDDTSDLTASSLKTDRDIVYRDLGGKELEATAVVDLEDEEAVAAPTEAPAGSGTYGLLRRAYDGIARVFKKVSGWFGIRDERSDR